MGAVSSAHDSARNAASDGAPLAVAKATPSASCSASGRVARPAVRLDPLSAMARWNSPFASGDAVRACVFDAPADWPPTVTLPGSPPNPAMWSCTQRSAAMRSSSA